MFAPTRHTGQTFTLVLAFGLCVAYEVKMPPEHLNPQTPL